METSAPAPVAAPAATEAAQPAVPGTSATQGAKEAAKPAAPAKPELFEVKVDGKTVKMTREEMINHASMGHASDKRFKEAAQMRKQAEAVLGRIRDPKQFIVALQDPALGLSKDQIRETFEEWYVKEYIEPESLSPAEKRAREAEAKLQKYQDDEKQREEQKLKDQQDAMTAKAREEVQDQIIEALESSNLPKTNFTIRRLAYWIQRNTANGFNAPTEVLVGQVRNEFNSSMRDMVEASDGETLIKLLGDNLVQKLRKYDLEQLRKTRGQPAAPSQDTPAPAAPKSERPPTSAEVSQRIRQLQKTGRY